MRRKARIKMGDISIAKSFAAEQDKIPFAIEFITASAENAGLSGTFMLKLQLVVEEAVTNVCSYAYPDGEGTFEIRIDSNSEYITVTISDEGKPFNPIALSQPDISTGIEERPVGGLGVFLMRKLVDEIVYERVNSKNVLRMKITY